MRLLFWTAIFFLGVLQLQAQPYSKNSIKISAGYGGGETGDWSGTGMWGSGPVLVVDYQRGLDKNSHFRFAPGVALAYYIGEERNHESHKFISSGAHAAIYGDVVQADPIAFVLGLGGYINFWYGDKTYVKYDPNYGGYYGPVIQEKETGGHWGMYVGMGFRYANQKRIAVEFLPLNLYIFPLYGVELNARIGVDVSLNKSRTRTRQL